MTKTDITITLDFDEMLKDADSEWTGTSVESLERYVIDRVIADMACTFRDAVAISVQKRIDEIAAAAIEAIGTDAFRIRRHRDGEVQEVDARQYYAEALDDAVVIAVQGAAWKQAQRELYLASRTALRP